MNLSPIPSNFRKGLKLDEDFFSIEEERDSSIENFEKKNEKKIHSLLDLNIEMSENNEENKKKEELEEGRKESLKNFHNLIKPIKENLENPPQLNFKKRLSRAVESNILMELEKYEKESAEKKSQNSKDSSEKEESNSSSSEKSSSNNSSSVKSSYSYSSSSSSISIENQEKIEIDYMKK